MNKNFVTYEIALKLKEKEFNCTFPFGLYNIDKDFMSLYTSDKLHFQYSEYYEQEEYLIAPTISQVLKWLREEKKIHISIDIWGGTWGYDVLNLPTGNSLHWTAYDENINNYEQAAIAGIEYVLDNLI
jgi:hypothetical protein